MLVWKNANFLGRRLRQVFHAKPKRWSGSLMTEREILRHFDTSLQEKNQRRYLHNFVFLVEAMKGERDLQPVDLFCMSLPPMPFTTGCCLTFL